MRLARVSCERPHTSAVAAQPRHALPSSGTDSAAKEQGANSPELAELIAEAAADKKATDIAIVDMRGVVDYTDYMIVCTGNTPRQTKAISDEVRRRLKEDHGIFPRRVEGEREGEWILLDFLDAVVHVFTPQAREFYRLDRLWKEAPQTAYTPPVPEDGRVVAP